MSHMVAGDPCSWSHVKVCTREGSNQRPSDLESRAITAWSITCVDSSLV